MRELRADECACLGGETRSLDRGETNNEMRECVVCERAVRWDMTEHPFFGFGDKPCKEALAEFGEDEIADAKERASAW